MTRHVLSHAQKVTLPEIKQRMSVRLALLPEDHLPCGPAVIAYERQLLQIGNAESMAFVQLDSYVFAMDMGDKPVAVDVIRKRLEESVSFARTRFRRDFPRWSWLWRLAALATIIIVVSSRVDQDAIDFCEQLKTRKKWMRYRIPVIVDSSTLHVYVFDKYPRWGGMFYRYLKTLVNDITPAPTTTLAADA